MRALHWIFAIAWIVAPGGIAGAEGPASPGEVAVARAALSVAQARSFRENREFCGYLGYDRHGNVAIGPMTRGQRDECSPLWPDDLDVVASWHTHAGYDSGAWSEVPTVIDIEADEAEGIDGYVATPGGRFWFVDTTAMEVVRMCPRGCVPGDPRFVPGSEGEIAHSYSYADMLAREAAQ